MKNLITLLILVTSNFAFAGGSVGTMRTAQEQLQNGSLKTNKSELIFNMGTRDGLQKFAQARLIKGQWEVSEHIAPLEAVQVDFDFSQALVDSKTVQDWVQLK
ncbi:hypothetical protein CIK05_11080 [Bdellovibrio sp. qaytius]|nr:hypothetical protein CIK05_11080 [Bdellovibrio sp. qaytius]